MICRWTFVFTRPLGGLWSRDPWTSWLHHIQLDSSLMMFLEETRFNSTHLVTYRNIRGFESSWKWCIHLVYGSRDHKTMMVNIKTTIYWNAGMKCPEALRGILDPSFPFPQKDTALWNSEDFLKMTYPTRGVQNPIGPVGMKCPEALRVILGSIFPFLYFEGILPKKATWYSQLIHSAHWRRTPQVGHTKEGQPTRCICMR